MSNRKYVRREYLRGGRTITVLALALCTLASFGQPCFAEMYAELIKDINTEAVSSSPELLTYAEGTTFFTAATEDEGRELWKTDGTEAGTVLVKDIAPGTDSSDPQPPLRAVGSRVFFRAYLAATGWELWVSDGTEAGTNLVADLLPGEDEYELEEFTSMNGLLYFTVSSHELWVSDGTAAGTFMLMEWSQCRDLAVMNGNLYFFGNDTVNGWSLWTSDGTAPGTALVRDHLSSLENLTASGNMLFFTAYDAAAGVELWKSDGTGPGTGLAKDINPGLGTSDLLYCAALNGLLYFLPRLSNGGPLWRSDGTTDGTYTLLDHGTISGTFSYVNGLLFFCSETAAYGRELSMTPGCASLPTLVKDIWPGPEDGGMGGPVVIGNTLYFGAKDPDHGSGLWKTDGTADGTVLVKDTGDGPEGSIGGIIDAGGVLLLSAYDPQHGMELWISDGTEAGTRMVKDINTATSAGVGGLSYANRPAVLNQELFFRAVTTEYGTELWRSDGTEAGTQLVKDIMPGGDTSEPGNLVPLDTRVCFVATDPVNGRELWSSDGTDAGTILLKDIEAGNWDANPESLTKVNGSVMFKIEKYLDGGDLWRTDGTPGGTMLVRSFTNLKSQPSKEYYPHLRNFVEMNGKLYFTRHDTNGSSPTELWRSDGTYAGTARVKTIYPGESWTEVYPVVAMGNAIYFVVTHEVAEFVSVCELWRSDGTEAGTTVLRSGFIAYSVTDYQISWLLPVGNTLYFRAVGSTDTGAELWATDGTPGGTRLVRDIRPGPEPSKIVGAAAFNGMLYFSANDGIHGAELWRSNGTEAGTVLVSDIFPGVDSSSPGNFITFQNELVFSANDGVNGIELWHSDGTASGTELGRDIYPGLIGSRPGNFFAVDGKLLFTANNGPTRTEWWRAYAQGDYYPLARFSTDMSSGLYPLTVQFTDHSMTGAASITDWLWDFGDGETSTERNPVHTYLDRGRYTVTLTVTTPLGTHTYVVPNGVWAAEEMPAATGIGIALGMIALILTSFTRLIRTKSGN